jgi:hypothetical protein
VDDAAAFFGKFSPACPTKADDDGISHYPPDLTGSTGNLRTSVSIRVFEWIVTQHPSFFTPMADGRQPQIRILSMTEAGAWD